MTMLLHVLILQALSTPGMPAAIAGAMGGEEFEV
jgi:hypothetical protein